MDHATYCKDIAIRIPGEETEQLARKAKEYDVYLPLKRKWWIRRSQRTDSSTRDSSFLQRERSSSSTQRTSSVSWRDRQAPMISGANGWKGMAIRWKPTILSQRPRSGTWVCASVRRRCSPSHFGPLPLTELKSSSDRRCRSRPFRGEPGNSPVGHRHFQCKLPLGPNNGHMLPSARRRRIPFWGGSR